MPRAKRYDTTGARLAPMAAALDVELHELLKGSQVALGYQEQLLAAVDAIGEGLPAVPSRGRHHRVHGAPTGRPRPQSWPVSQQPTASL